MPAEEGESFSQLADSFSEQDLIRFFSILVKTEQDIRDSSQPRFHLEIGLMKLVHAGRLYLLEDAIAKLGEIQASLPKGAALVSQSSIGARPQPARDPLLPSRGALPARIPSSPSSTPKPQPPRGDAGSGAARPYSASGSGKATSKPETAPEPPPILDEPYLADSEPRIAHANTGGQPDVESILNRLESQRKNMLLAVLHHAVSIRLDGDSLRVSYKPSDKMFRDKLEARETRKTLEEVAGEVHGRKITLSVTTGTDAVAVVEGEKKEVATAGERAEDHPAVRSLLDVFHGEVIEVIKPD